MQWKGLVARLITVSAPTLVVALMAGGCGDRDDANAPAAQASAAAATAADPYQRYVEAVTPLGDELKRMKLLLMSREGSKLASFEPQHREVRFQFEKLASSLGDEDKARASWQYASTAVERLAALHKGLIRLEEIGARAERTARRPAGREDAASSLADAKQSITDFKDLAILSEKTIPDLMAEAGKQIPLFETALAERR